MSTSTDHLPCRCGNVWFNLDSAITPDGLNQVAAVTVSDDGSISAYTGDLVCTHCGARFETVHDLADVTMPEADQLTGTDDRPSLRLIVDNT